MSAAEKLLTFREAAQQCECSPRMLRRQADSGELATVRLGSSAKSDRIHPADLAAFIARRRRCQSTNDQTPELGRLLSVGADERLDALVHAGRGNKRGRSNGKSSMTLPPLKLVESSAGRSVRR